MGVVSLKTLYFLPLAFLLSFASLAKEGNPTYVSNQVELTLEELVAKDTAEIRLFYEKAFPYHKTFPKIAIRVGELIINACEQKRWAKGKAYGYILIGNAHLSQSDYHTAIRHFNMALKPMQLAKDFYQVALIQNYLGSAFRVLGRHEEAISYHLLALHYFEKKELYKQIITTQINIGNVSFARRNFTDALSYYIKAYNLAEEIDELSLQAEALHCLGEVQFEMGEHEEALERHLAALHLQKQTRNRRGVMLSYVSIGRVYRVLKQYNLAFQYFDDSIEMSLRENFKRCYAIALIEKGNTYLNMGILPKSDHFLLKGFEVAKEIGDVELLRRAYEQLYMQYEESSNNDKALFYLKKWKSLDDSLYSEQKEEIIRTLETEYKVSQKAEQITKLEQDNENKQSTIALQKTLGNIIGAFSILLAFLVYVLFQENRKKREGNESLKEMNKDLHSKQLELLSHQEELEEKTKALKQKNEDITDSITYASKIQKALMPIHNKIGSFLSEYFILFKPLHIVSGDFYWFHVDESGSAPIIFIAVADCTGHGVPGAFMSVLGNSILKETVIQRKFFAPPLILSALRKGIFEHLKPDETKSVDGMEIGLCVIDIEKAKMNYAGAGIPLVYFQNGQQYVIKGDKTNIGGKLSEIDKPYTNHEINLDSPTSFYMYSDGYQDQFGGPYGKKVMSKRFRKLLMDVQSLNFEGQKDLLDTFLKDWQGHSEPQTDDILIFGAKVDLKEKRFIF